MKFESMKTILLPCLCLAAVLLSADARYRFEIRVLRFSNPGNQDFNGGCCDLFCDNCEIYFNFCIRNYLHRPLIDNSFLTCTYGYESTGRNPISTSFRTFTVGQNIAGSVTNPLVFTGDSWPGQVQIAVGVQDADDGNADDLIDRVVLDQRVAVSSSFSSTISSRGFYDKVTMEFQFRAMCETNYYGSRCTTLCVSQATYTCDSNGRRVCNTGYTGVDCLTIACATGCQGMCTGPNLCDRCDPGFGGALCDVCELAPGCDADRAFCTAPGDCRCNPGYSGTLCQIDDDVCGHRAPCVNGGACTNTGPDAYVCACPAHFTGTNCDVEIDMCDSSPCLNGATCERIPGSFTCSCGLGWTGSTCNINIDECASTVSPCQNGGTCTDCVLMLISVQPPGTTPPCLRGYMCECQEGFFGDNCEVDVDYCLPDMPCQNGGTCHDIVGGPGYLCTCPQGYTGINCEADVDECALDMCQNGGVCTNSLGSFSCSCLLGFTGPECEIDIDDCASSPCHAPNTQRCEDRVNAYFCNCVPGYTGMNCEDIFDMCDAFPCMNGGTCMSSFNDFTCECPVGFTGVECSININDCHPDLCLFGGICIDKVDDYTCQCNPGHTGRQCETEVDPCTLDPCPSITPVCIRTASGGTQCIPCVSTEAGCETPFAQGGNNGTQPGDNSASVGGIAGGVVAGVVAALLLLVILTIACCCCRKQCCCCCYGAVEKEDDVVEAQDGHAQNNPLYFGVSTIVSSTGGSMPRYKQPGIAQTDIDNGYTALNSTDDSENHYEHIPAQLGNDNVRETMVSGSYNHLLDNPADNSACDQKLGKYDSSLKKRGGQRENPYVVGPVLGGIDQPYTVGPEARARQDMYTFLPTPEQLEKPTDK